MLDLGTLKIGVKVDDKAATQGLKNVDSKIEETSTRSSKLHNLSSKLATSFKILGAAGVAALGKVAKEAFSCYSDYEQLSGGVEKLFGTSSKTVMKNAQKAYKTAGMSANQYMEQATSFSAALIQSCSGNTAKAAKVADVAMRDMSDNANVFGTDMERITDAYQGFAKQNYTMLDNLKLGYGGTKTEMERLLADAGKLAGTKYDITNLQDVYEAIHVIQQEQQITGTTASEASHTVEGAITSMKAAWSNWLVSLGSGEDVGAKTQALMDSIANVIRNAVPVIANIAKNLFTGVADAIGNELTSAYEHVEDFCNKNKTAFQLVAVGAGALAVALAAYNASAIVAAVSSGAETVALTAMIVAENLATIATTALGVAFNFLTAPITLIIAGVAALVAGIILLVKHWDTVKAVLAKGINAVINSKPVQVAITIFNKLKAVFLKVKAAIAKGIQFVVNSKPVQVAITVIKTLIKIYSTILKTVAKAVKFVVKYGPITAAKKAIETLCNWWDSLKEKAKKIITFRTQTKESKSSSNSSSHRIGLREVPYDGYVAELHKGESILTAAEANQYKKYINNDLSSQSLGGVSELVQALKEGSITVVTQIDGKNVAQTTAPFMNNELNRLTTRSNRKVGVL